jgi:hypothetical protein
LGPVAFQNRLNNVSETSRQAAGLSKRLGCFNIPRAGGGFLPVKEWNRAAAPPYNLNAAYCGITANSLRIVSRNVAVT